MYLFIYLCIYSYLKNQQLYYTRQKNIFNFNKKEDRDSFSMIYLFIYLKFNFPLLYLNISFN